MQRAKMRAPLNRLYLMDRLRTGAHFNLKSRRNAASVHLAYPTGRNYEYQRILL